MQKLTQAGCGFGDGYGYGGYGYGDGDGYGDGGGHGGDDSGFTPFLFDWCIWVLLCN